MKKFLLSIFCLVIMAATSSAETYTHTFEEGQLTAAGGTVTLSDIEWNASSATSIGWNSNGKGIQIGSGSNPNPSYSLTTSALSTSAIKSITVKAVQNFFMVYPFNNKGDYLSFSCPDR